MWTSCCLWIQVHGYQRVSDLRGKEEPRTWALEAWRQGAARGEEVGTASRGEPSRGRPGLCPGVREQSPEGSPALKAGARRGLSCQQSPCGEPQPLHKARALASAQSGPAHSLGLQVQWWYYSQADFCFLFEAKKDIKLSKRLFQHSSGWVEVLGESLLSLCSTRKWPNLGF